jgi:hypothetical protein
LNGRQELLLRTGDCPKLHSSETDDEERVGEPPKTGCDGLVNSAQAAKQYIRAIAVGGQAELTAWFSQPKDGLGRPVLIEVEYELGCQ